ncbi:hypothetical protein VTK73DRAFT_5208 [Phialemonium thermophilum]|uniref:Uncharacterized protein n=1 Tax=Phialemonium thermophilum TaxID=223376 RepID=A0ABR3WQ29_9PEZI
MTVLHKAAASPDDAAALANRTNLVAELVRRWLLSPHAQIGANGRRVLGDLLDVDCPLPPPPESSPVVQMQMVRRRATGHGAIWRLLFRDRDMYRLLIDIVSGRHRETGGEGNDKGGQRSHQLSLAQGRLLDILPRLAALDFATVSSSDFPAGTPVHATNGGGVHSPSDGQAGDVVSGGSRHDGLLQFAALRMIDKRDMIMHLTLIEFFEGFLSLMRVTEHTPYKLETIRALLREATADDERLRAALDTLPDRTVPEEAEELRSWLQEVLPRRPVQLVGHRF